ncbi:hypothetical protein C2845_PM07G13800 [Panicum miliaceum]|uniref:Uncharacterized protein n=1 Tax=Panicum miliaceum TaxID=4540 RepID=A0A3L6SJW5_PANMI|nr:hypothetical protein C2845_PM07G13800 [Panicum miliaceum]
MAAHPFDLNLEPPVLDLNNPAIDWDGVGVADWDAPAHELVEVDIMAREDGDGETLSISLCSLLDDANEQDVAGPMGHGGVGGNAAADRSPVLHHGVSKVVALKFGVPLRLVQSVWRNGQDYGGTEGVGNKLVKNCGHKKVEIDMEAIKDVPLRERKIIKDLANALGVKKTTLYNRFKKGYFRRHTN